MPQLKKFFSAGFILILFAAIISAQTYRDVKPNLEIFCPKNEIRAGEKAVFTASVKTEVKPLVYNWNVSAGTIAKGQGTSVIEVETSPDIMEVTASVEVENIFFEPVTASCTARLLTLPKANLTAEFPFSTQGYIKMMLDGTLFLELQNDPSATGYIYIFPKTPREKAVIERIIRNQIKVRNFDASRITIVSGAKNSRSVLQFWLVPAGAEIPVPTLKVAQ